MRNKHFKEYSSCSSNFEYSQLPFTKVDSSKVYIKTSHREETYVVSIVKKRNLRVLPPLEVFPSPKIRKQKTRDISEEKKKDLRHVEVYAITRYGVLFHIKHLKVFCFVSKEKERL